MITLTEDYYDPDEGGGPAKAAARMEARAQEPASDALFRDAVLPLLRSSRSVLELGCGTAWVSRRVGRHLNHSSVLATDKDPGLVEVARRYVERERLRNVQATCWDVLDEDSFPFKVSRYELILSSMLVPCLDAEQVEGLVVRMRKRLENGGTLAFLEQDLMSDTLHDPTGLARTVLAKEDRPIHRLQAVGLRKTMRDAGLKLLPVRSFLWVDDRYGPYLRERLPSLADAARERGALTEEESSRFKRAMDSLALSRDFHYTMTYHLIAAEL